MSHDFALRPPDSVGGGRVRTAIAFLGLPRALRLLAIAEGLRQLSDRFVDSPVAQLGERLERILRRTHFPRES
ncbi:MAG: hypothetical protein WBY94_31150 [Polyangiaceae bacterium]